MFRLENDNYRFEEEEEDGDSLSGQNLSGLDQLEISACGEKSLSVICERLNRFQWQKRRDAHTMINL